MWLRLYQSAIFRLFEFLNNFRTVFFYQFLKTGTSDITNIRQPLKCLGLILP